MAIQYEDIVQVAWSVPSFRRRLIRDIMRCSRLLSICSTVVKHDTCTCAFVFPVCC